MRVVVTGAGGSIGRAVVARLRAGGAGVVALSKEPFPAEGLAVVVGDAGDPAVVAEALRGGADAVVHLAAIPSPERDPALDVFSGNTRATFAVLDEAARRGVPRAVLASSYALLGMPFSPHELHPPYYPLDEQAPPQVEDPYALSKLVDELTGEMVHRRHGTDVVALRFPFTADTARLAGAAAKVRADPASGARNSWAYLHVEDAAEAVWLAVTRPLRGFHRVFLAATETLSPLPTAELVAAHHPGVPVRAPLPGRRVPIDTTAAERLLGFRPSYSVPV